MLRGILAAVAVLVALTAPAHAAVLDEALPGTPGTTAIACQDGWRPGTAGIASKAVKVPLGPARLDVALDGARGDWDVAVFDTAGHVLAASAQLGSLESALGYTATGGTMRVQACRRSGRAAVVPVSLRYTPLLGDIAQARANAPQLVRVHARTREERNRLNRLGLDVVESGTSVVLHGDTDRALLQRAGFSFDVLVRDLVAQSLRERRADFRSAQGRALPSGREGTYRRLADYNAEMKALAEANPKLVRLFTLPEKTLLGKEVMGIEIAEDVTARDGRPAFLNMGVHHAREWPAGEMPMEWAYELINGYKSGDARATKVVKKSRNIIVPIVNPDGFEASREAGELGGAAGGRDPSVDDTVYLVAGALTGGEYRRKNCRLPDGSDGAQCAIHAGIIEGGVDINRNYGGLWGGPGASSDVTAQDFRGAGPFSEPESRNIETLISRNQVMTMITNHTTAGLVLRAPGLAILGDPFDEAKGYKQLGDDMARENGYFSQKGFELYDTTGTAEDWSYNATGGFGFTFEIYCGNPNYTTGDCDAPSFHPTYATGVTAEWDGTNPMADHTNDPGPNAHVDGKGNREAYYIAAESTINKDRHGILEGTAPAGAVLKLEKSFKTSTFAQPPDNQPLTIDDKLTGAYDVGSDGTFSWHVNPSTRPIVAKDHGKENAGPPSPEETTTGSPAGSSETADDPDDGAALPALVLGALLTTNYNDHPFTIPAGGDNASLSIAVSWATPASDWDIELYEDVDGNAKSDPAVDKLVATSGTSDAIEQVSISGAEALTPGKKYVLRVINFAAAEPYTVKKTYVAPEPFTPGKVEKWTLSCVVDGKTLETTQVEVKRGETVTPDLSKCVKQAGGAGGGGGGGGGGNGGGGGGGSACTAVHALQSVSATPGPRGVRFGVTRAASASGPVGVSVFQRAIGRQVIPPRFRARFKVTGNRVVWNGKAKDGYFVVRFRLNGDTRRIALKRRGGTFKVLKSFHSPAKCGVVRQFKLGAPVFGAAGLRISTILGEQAGITVIARRGSKVVKRFSAKTVKPGAVKRFRLRAKKPGTYRVTLKTPGTKKITLFSRRL